MRQRTLSQRPTSFRINNDCALAQGLVFAGLGAHGGSTLYRDSSPYGNHGTLTGMTPSTAWVWIPEANRWGVTFAAGSERIILANTLVLNPPYSISCLIYPTLLLGDTRQLLGVDSNNRFMIGADGGLNHIAGSAGGFSEATTASPVVINQLQQVGLIRHGTGTTMTWYRNGVAFDTDSSTNTEAWQCNGVGNRSDYGDDYIGVILDVLIHSGECVESQYALADPSNVMLSGLVLPPKRRLFPGYTPTPTTTTTKKFIRLRTSSGKNLIVCKI